MVIDLGTLIVMIVVVLLIVTGIFAFYQMWKRP